MLKLHDSSKTLHCHLVLTSTVMFGALLGSKSKNKCLSITAPDKLTADLLTSEHDVLLGASGVTKHSG